MAKFMQCPKCDADISDSYQEDDPINCTTGSWCCDLVIGLDDIDDEP